MAFSPIGLQTEGAERVARDAGQGGWETARKGPAHTDRSSLSRGVCSPKDGWEGRGDLGGLAAEPPRIAGGSGGRLCAPSPSSLPHPVCRLAVRGVPRASASPPTRRRRRLVAPSRSPCSSSVSQYRSRASWTPSLQSRCALARRGVRKTDRESCRAGHTVDAGRTTRRDGVDRPTALESQNGAEGADKDETTEIGRDEYCVPRCSS